MVDSRGGLERTRIRWNGETNGRPRSWCFDVDESRLKDELANLCREIYRYEAAIAIVRFGAPDRLSDRG